MINLLISVQAEFYQNKFWFSIAYVSKTKDRTKDKARLQKSNRSFIVHFPGESYFYAAGSKLSPHLGEAVSESLYSTGYTIVPLTGMFGKKFLISGKVFLFCRFFVFKRFAPFASFLVNYFINQEEIFVFLLNSGYTYHFNIYAVPKSFVFTANLL